MVVLKKIVRLINARNMEHVKLYTYSFFIFVYLILWGPPVSQDFPQLSAPQKK
jgi:hypothetical protein